ncbi:MAG TPA: serine hydrolase [Tepidisphaeraceae bacterium]|jgi:CubicO group peptidase (beta-lactamase class C family)
MKLPIVRLVLTVLLAPIVVFAQATKPVNITKAELDEHVRTFIDGQYCPGMVIGIIDSSGPKVFGYGSAVKGGQQPPTGDTLFELGPATKLLTATLYAQMAQAKEVQGNQAVDTLLTDMKIPAFGGNKIWLGHLASHTSGLPGNPPNSSAQADNPFLGYTQRQFKEFLAAYPLPRLPGDRYDYSNIGYALLAQSLAKKNNKTFEQTVIERICMPLGMKDTRITLTDDLRPRLAHAYTVDGDEVNYWESPPMEGAVGFKTTANDMLKFCAAHIGTAPAPFADAIKSMQSRQIDVDRQNDMGIGWLIGRKYNILWLNGETAGQHCFIGCMPKNKTAIVVLANSSFKFIDAMASALVKALAGERVVPALLKVPATIDPNVLQAYDGEYAVDRSDQSLTVSHNGTSLFLQPTNQPKLHLYAEDESNFFAKSMQARVEFRRGEDGKVQYLVFHTGGQQIPARKVK